MIQWRNAPQPDCGRGPGLNLPTTTRLIMTTAAKWNHGTTTSWTARMAR